MESSSNTGGVTGASNARDFQPPTQNPQTGAISLQESTLSTQPSGGSSGAINQGNLIPQTSRQLSVQTQQASTGQIAPLDTAAGPGGFGFFPLLILAVVGAALVGLAYKLRQTGFTEAPALEMAGATPVQQSAPPVPAKKRTAKKRKPKKKR